MGKLTDALKAAGRGVKNGAPRAFDQSDPFGDKAWAAQRKGSFSLHPGLYPDAPVESWDGVDPNIQKFARRALTENTSTDDAVRDLLETARTGGIGVPKSFRNKYKQAADLIQNTRSEWDPNPTEITPSLNWSVNPLKVGAAATGLLALGANRDEAEAAPFGPMKDSKLLALSRLGERRLPPVTPQAAPATQDLGAQIQRPASDVARGDRPDMWSEWLNGSPETDFNPRAGYWPKMYAEQRAYDRHRAATGHFPPETGAMITIGRENPELLKRWLDDYLGDVGVGKPGEGLPLLSLPLAGGLTVAGVLGARDADAMNIGPAAKTWNKAAAKAAKSMERDALRSTRFPGPRPDAHNIYAETGTFRGLGDNKWRQEIDDSGAKLTGVMKGRLSDVLDHPALFEAYPQIGRTPTTLKIDPGKALSGYHLSLPGFERIGLRGSTEDDLLSGLLHESQHGVQEIERFAPGGSPLPMFMRSGWHRKNYSGMDPIDFYERLPGEVEARLTQARQPLSAEERANLYPLTQPRSWADEAEYGKHGLDVHPADVIERWRHQNPWIGLAKAAGAGAGAYGASKLLLGEDADAMPRARVPKLPQPRLPSTALDWAAEDARGAAREAARAKGIVPRGGADGGGAAAFDLFGDRAAPLVQAADDALTVTPRGGAIPLRSPTGRLPPGGATRLEALGKISENPLLTRPGMPERAHAIDPTYLGKTLGGGAAIAGGATGLFGPSLTDAVRRASIENDAISTDRRTMQRLADAMGLDLANTKSAPSMGAAPDGVYRASLPEVLAAVTDQRGPVTRDDFAAASATGRAVELGAQLRQAGRDTKEGFAKKPLRTALDVSSWLPIIGDVTGPVSMALDLLSGKNHAPAPSDLQGVKRWAAMTPSQKYNRIQQGYVDDRDPRFAFMPPLAPNSSPYFVPELPTDYGQRRQLPR